MGGGYLLIIFVLLVITNGITYGASQLTSESVSYTKDGQVITVKKALDELITKSSKVDELEEHVKVYKYADLSDVAKVGDYVAYDAGEWKESAETPTTQGRFGGYKINTSKNSSVSCDESSTTIVHAGQPECYFHGLINDNCKEESVEALNARAQSTYIDGKYAASAHAMTKDEVETNTTASDNLRKTGVNYYWLATPVDSSRNGLWVVRIDGGVFDGGYNQSHGFRPVIVLKSGILTTGQKPDKVGNDKAWTLVLQ